MYDYQRTEYYLEVMCGCGAGLRSNVIWHTQKDVLDSFLSVHNHCQTVAGTVESVRQHPDMRPGQAALNGG